MTESIAPVDRYAKAVEHLETRLTEARDRRERLHAETAAAVLKAITAGKDPTDGTRHAALAEAEVAQVERALEAARAQLAIERHKQAQADVQRRWRETEGLVTGEMLEAFQKLQAGCDLLIAGHRQVGAVLRQVHTTIPKQPDFWPAEWTTHLGGYIRLYIGARTDLFNVLPSERPEILEGPDLVERHRQAVRQLLGDFTTDTRNAA